MSAELLQRVEPHRLSWGQRLAVVGLTAVAAFGVAEAGAPVAAYAGSTPVFQAASSPGFNTAAPDVSEMPEPDVEKGPAMRVSYNQCRQGSGAVTQGLCGRGCGVAASANVISDLTGQRVTPREVLTDVKGFTKYYRPMGGGGTDPKAFQAFSKRYHLKEKHTDLTGAKRVIIKQGGVAIAEFNAGLARQRGGVSKIAVNDHYVTIDRVKNGKFAIADSHKGHGRHTETYKNGKTRYWTAGELYKQGLRNVWSFRTTSRTNVYKR